MENYLYERLRQISPDDSLYNDLKNKCVRYYETMVRIGQTPDGSRSKIHLQEEASGRLNDLEKIIEKINYKLACHEPPLQALPRKHENIKRFVDNFIGKTFQSRKK